MCAIHIFQTNRQLIMGVMDERDFVRLYVLHIDGILPKYQKGPTRHAYAWQIGPFWRDTLDMFI